MKAIKYVIYAVIGLLLLAVAAAVIFALSFEPNRYKDDIERIAKERTGRTLNLRGDLEVAFWPSLGAKVGGVTLSERNADTQFLALDSAHASVALLPLLRGEVIVDGINVSGLKARIIKGKDGRFNFQDLLGEEKSSPAGKTAAPSTPAQQGQAVKFDIGEVKIEGSALSYRDLATGQEFGLQELNLSTGRIAEKAQGELDLSAHVTGREPALDANLKLAANYRIDLPAKSFALSKLDAEVSGAAAGLTNIAADVSGDIAANPEKNQYRLSGLNVNFKGTQGKDALAASLVAPSLVIDENAAKGEAVNANFSLKGENRSAEAAFKLAGVQGSAKALIIPQFTAEVALTSPELPMKSLKVPVSGNLRADLEKQTANADLKAKIEDSNVEAKLGLARFSPPAYRFDVAIDQINLDRYLPPEKAAAAAASGSQKSAPPPAETPVDLSALKGLDAAGRLQVGAMQARGLKLAKVRAEMKAANGRVEVSPHSADLYGGSLAGAITLQADGNRVSVKQKLSGISIGPLLRDFAEVDRLEGRGNLALDVAAAGATAEAMKRALDGSARIELRDGAVKGINIAEALRKAKAALGRGESQAASETQKTDFSELSATFAIKNGVAHNEDLDLKAPLFRITGSGDINIPKESIDYTTKVAVVASAQGQGGADLAELRGLTVPVHLSGSFDNLNYKVNYGAVAADLAKSRAGEKVREKVEAQREKLGEKLEERLGDKLKGLLKR